MRFWGQSRIYGPHLTVLAIKPDKRNSSGYCPYRQPRHSGRPCPWRGYRSISFINSILETFYSQSFQPQVLLSVPDCSQYPVIFCRQKMLPWTWILERGSEGSPLPHLCAVICGHFLKRAFPGTVLRGPGSYESRVPFYLQVPIPGKGTCR